MLKIRKFSLFKKNAKETKNLTRHSQKLQLQVHGNSAYPNISQVYKLLYLSFFLLEPVHLVLVIILYYNNIIAYPANISLFTINNRNSRKRCEICLFKVNNKNTRATSLT